MSSKPAFFQTIANLKPVVTEIPLLKIALPMYASKPSIDFGAFIEHSGFTLIFNS